MWFLAWRQLLSRKKQAILILLGIMFGGAMYIVISSMMLGFQQYMLQQLVDNSPHLTISSQEEYIEPDVVQGQLFSKGEYVHWMTMPSGVRTEKYINNPSGWYHFLSQQSNVLAYVPQIQFSTVASYRGLRQSVSVIGMDAEAQMKVTNVADDVTIGDFSRLREGGNQVVIATDLAKQFGLKLNDSMFLSNPSGTLIPYKIVGIYDTSMRASRYVVYMPLSSAQALDQENGRISTIGVRLNNPYSATQVVGQWQWRSDDFLESWQQQNRNILDVFKVQDFTRYFISAVVLIVSAFGIYNVLNIVINQKRREIAILRSMGYTKWDIVRLFLFQGILIGVVGGLLAVMLGYLCAYGLTLVKIGSDRGLMVSFDYDLYVIGFALAFLTSMVASVIPALRAGNLAPIAIIRGEDG